MTSKLVEFELHENVEQHIFVESQYSNKYNLNIYKKNIRYSPKISKNLFRIFHDVKQSEGRVAPVNMNICVWKFSNKIFDKLKLRASCGQFGNVCSNMVGFINFNR